MCGKILVWLPMKGMISLILLLVTHAFRGDEFLVVFFRQARDWHRKSGTGWDSLWGGCGLEVCEVGAGKIFPTPAGRVSILRMRGGSRQKFLTRAGLYCRNTAALEKFKCWPVILKVCQPRKHLSCCEYFPAEIPTKLNQYFYHHNSITFCIHYFV